MEKNIVKEYSEIIGQALFFAVLQMSISTIELDNRSDIILLKTQEEVDVVASSLHTYIVIAVIWTIASMLILYGQFGLVGAVATLIFNVAIILWVYFTYTNALQKTVQKNNLVMPKIF